MPPKKNANLTTKMQKANKKGWDCKMCLTNFTKDTDRLMECEFCHERYCIGCVDISEQMYKVLSDSDSMWFCPPCKVRVEKNIVTEKNIEKKCKEYMDKYEKRLAELESKINNKCDEMQVREIIADEIEKHEKQKTESMTKLPAVATQPMEEVVDNVVKEIKERESRDCNIVIYNLPEDNTNLKEERIKTDYIKITNLITDALHIPLDADEEITKAIRLGKKDESNNSSRPLLVTFKREDKKDKIMRVAYRLKDAEDHFKKCSIAYDLTIQERKNLKLKLTEAREKTEESSGKYKYKVKGPPWDLKLKRYDL